jgi:acyl-CoA synthetase (AMP-forming)/AMP-acid ligase II
VNAAASGSAATPTGGLWELLDWRAGQTPNALFAVDADDRRLSFAEYRECVLRCAAGLADRGVAEGTAVSWILPTWLESLVLAAALARLGARQNPILPIYRAREVSFICRQSGATLLVAPKLFRGFDYQQMAGEVASELPKLDRLLVDSGCDPMDLPSGDPSRLPAAASALPTGEMPIRWLFYTSGTTAHPKGALHTDASLFSAAAGLADVLSLGPDDRIALVFPLTHIGGVGWLLAGLLTGAAQIVVPTFDPATSIETLALHGVTQATAGTAFHQAYLEAQRARPDVPLFPAVRAFPGGGAPKPPQLHNAIRRELGGAGIVSGYGMTECPIVSMNRIGDPDDKLAHTEGRANPSTMRIRIVRPDGSPAGAGQEGEVRVNGPQLFAGYLDASLDSDAFDDTGFFRTGDLGKLDTDGFLAITGRLKDVIIRKGENISAKEIEDLLHGHPKVSEAAVVGLPDPASGERCCAVVVCRSQSEPLDFEEMVQFLSAQKLMRQKIPEQLELVDALPRNPTGKVLKQELRSRYTAHPAT